MEQFRERNVLMFIYVYDAGAYNNRKSLQGEREEFTIEQMTREASQNLLEQANKLVF